MSSVNFTNNKPILPESHTKIENMDQYYATNNEPKFEIKKTSFEDESNNNVSKPEPYSPSKSVYIKTGYKPTNKIATTLQGSIYHAMSEDGYGCVIKRASVQLHKRGVAYVNKKLYCVEENIIDEASIMKFLTANNPPKGLTKFIDFVKDNKNYFLLMEYGGESLLKHINTFHVKIKSGEIALKEWKKHVKILFKQMCVFVNWMHNKVRLAHLDISLENMLIKGCVFKNGEFISHGQINFIDFGLSQLFANSKTYKNCKKFVGKRRYQAPKVYHKIAFNAFKADIWSLGVILFMMIFGLCAYKEPTIKDPMFINIWSGNIDKWSEYLNLPPYVPVYVLPLFSHIFCNEDNRWCVKKILKHKFLKCKY